MNIRCLPLSVLLLSLLLSGCTVIAAEPTPEEAAGQMFPPPDQVRQVYAVKPALGGAVVVFQRPEVPPNDPDEITVGYALVTHGVGGWLAQGGSALTAAPRESDKILYFGSRLPTDQRTIVFGHALDPAVNTVDVTFATGQSVRDEVNNGLFAAVADAQTPPCVIRLFDRSERRIGLIDLTARTFPFPSLPLELRERARVECPTTGDEGK